MARTAKNLNIPFNCRKTHMKEKRGSIGSLPLGGLESLETMPKKAQLLCCYNLLSHKFHDKSVGKYRCESTQASSVQTVVVFDFDKTQEWYLKKTAKEIITEKFNTEPIIVNSFTGFHVIVPLLFSMNTDNSFRFIAKTISDEFPDFLKKHLDQTSFERTRHWYHSQHFSKWAKDGVINTTKKEQGKHRCFFADGMKNSDFVVYLSSNFHNFSELPDVALHYFFTWCVHHMENTNDTDIFTSASDFIRRILAETRRRGNPRELLSAFRSRTQALQSSPKRNLFASQFDDAVLEIERICRVDEELEDRIDGTGVTRSISDDRRCSQEASLFCDARHTEEGDRNHIGRDCGNEESSKRGLPDHSSLERVLAFVQEFSFLLRRERIAFNSLGYVVPEDSVREYEYWSHEPEKQNYVVFDGVCRQILERYCGESGVTGASYVGLYEWFRYTSRHLGNCQYGGRSLQQLTNEIARGIRLSDAILGTRRFQKLKETENNRFSYENIEHLERFADSLFDENWRFRIENERYAARLESFVKNHRDVFLRGLSRMFGWLGRFRGKISEHGVDIGIEQFEHWFGTKELAAYFRRLILGKIAFTDGRYKKHNKTKTWWFVKRFVDEWLPRLKASWDDALCVDVDEFAKKLGNGQTFEVLKKGVVSVFYYFGKNIKKASDFLHTALDKSCANDKKERHKEIDKYLNRVSHYKNVMAAAA